MEPPPGAETVAEVDLEQLRVLLERTAPEEEAVMVFLVQGLVEVSECTAEEAAEV